LLQLSPEDEETVMKNFHSVSSYLKLHEPLPWDVLDGRGQPLLRKGSVIDSQDQLEALLQRGVRRPELPVVETVPAEGVKVQVNVRQLYGYES
jgi:hypothetical protein